MMRETITCVMIAFMINLLLFENDDSHNTKSESDEDIDDFFNAIRSDQASLGLSYVKF